MKKFVTGPAPDNKMVNLENVTNIGFEEYYNRDGKLTYKIIFNYNYGVSLRNDFQKIISDYNYFVYSEAEKPDYDKLTDQLSELINEKGWIAPLINGTVSRIANPKLISFVATDKRKNRIILNLATTVSFYSNIQRKTSDFLYFDFGSEEEFNENLEYIRAQLDIDF